MKGRHVIEKKWASEKYNVMWHSQKYYNRIREEMNKGASMDLLESMIFEAKKEKPTKGSIVNTFDHMWGYFKRICTLTEKYEYKKIRALFFDDKIKDIELKRFIIKLSNQYDMKYLQESTILNI